MFADVYGMVELSGPMALKLYLPTPSKSLSLPSFSIALPGFSLRTVNEDGQPVRWGEDGYLEVKGPGVLKGYEGHPEAGPTNEGWFSTGDLARCWPGGVFTLTGRSKDRLKVGGFSVFPAEVETELRTLASVRDVVLVGLPDERMGERPVALVVPHDPMQFQEEAFLQEAATIVAGYRRPRHAMIIDDIPRGNHGKINRNLATSWAKEKWAERQNETEE
jgi:acyl-CoA synthetase (AMP-forming)/AMP-acid ligase II